jgi:hypothetical protein
MLEKKPPQLISVADDIMIAVIMIVLIASAMIRVKPKPTLKVQSE